MNMSNIKCESKSEVKREQPIPTARVTAKPFTALVPNTIRTTAAMIVVTLESIIVQKALAKPAFTTSYQLFNIAFYSLILS